MNFNGFGAKFIAGVNRARAGVANAATATSNVVLQGSADATNIIKTVTAPALLLGGTALMGKAMLDPAIERSKQKKAYKNMVAERGLEDNKETQDYFNVVRTFSPLAATNPIVAATMVNRMKEFGGVDPNMVAAMTNIKSQENKAGVAMATATGSAIGQFNPYAQTEQMIDTGNAYLGSGAASITGIMPVGNTLSVI